MLHPYNASTTQTVAFRNDLLYIQKVVFAILKLSRAIGCVNPNSHLDKATCHSDLLYIQCISHRHSREVRNWRWIFHRRCELSSPARSRRSLKRRFFSVLRTVRQSMSMTPGNGTSPIPRRNGSSRRRILGGYSKLRSSNEAW